MIKVILSDDEFLVRAGLRATIDWEENGYEVIGEASNGEDTLDLCRRLRPDILLTDIRMPRMDGIELVKILSSEMPDIKVIILTAYNEFAYAQQSLRCGAVDYILKLDLEQDMLMETLDRVRKQHFQNRGAAVPNSPQKDGIETVNLFFDLSQGCVTESTAQLLTDNGFNPVDMHLTAISIRAVLPESHDAGTDYGTVWQIIQAQMVDILKKAGHCLMTGDGRGAFTAIVDYPMTQALCQRMTESIPKAISLHIRMGVSRHKEDGLRQYLAALRESRMALDICRSVSGTPYCIYDAAADAGGISNALVRSVCNYIEEHLAEDLSLKTTAQNFHVDASYFCRLFKQQTGDTYLEYLTDKRMKKAMELLAVRDFQIQEVAEMTGYNSCEYFSRVFKKITGLSPNDYRRIV